MIRHQWKTTTVCCNSGTPAGGPLFVVSNKIDRCIWFCGKQSEKWILPPHLLVAILYFMDFDDEHRNLFQREKMMSKLLKRAVVSATLVSTLFGSTLALADVAPSAIPPVMAKVTQAGVKVVKEFKAIGGLNGWVLMRGAQPAIAYTTADGKALLFGALVDSRGQNMTAAYMAKYTPKPDLTKLIPALQHSTYVTLGNPSSKHVIYAFEDPNCIFCHLTDIELQPYVKAGLQVRVVVVGFLKKSSAGKAAAILEAKNPAAAWEANEAGFNEAAEEGAATPLAHPSARTISALQANMQLMQKFGFNGTPGIVYQVGGKWQTVNGMPQESLLPAMTGLPLQKETNPQLARFQH